MQHFPKAVLDHLPDPVILIGAQRQVLDMNRAAHDMLGSGQPGQDLAIALRHPDILRAVDSVIAGGEHVSVETTLPGSPPRTVAARVEGLNAEETTEGIAAVLVITDLTALKQTERMRADFVANASHELRSPLSSIIGFLETLSGPAKDDAQARERFIGIMLREARRMTGLIDDLLSLSRVEINEHVRPTDITDIAGIIENVTETLAYKAAERGMTITVDVANDIAAVRGDSEQLVQVFQNLSDNAIKYGHENSQIHIALTSVERIPGSREGGVAVAVIDQGDGIPTESLPRLTERFYRADKARSREMGSTGLGLAICKHIISRHRGHLVIESILGKGSTFTVYLPVAEPR